MLSNLICALVGVSTLIGARIRHRVMTELLVEIVSIVISYFQWSTNVPWAYHAAKYARILMRATCVNVMLDIGCGMIKKGAKQKVTCVFILRKCCSIHLNVS